MENVQNFLNKVALEKQANELLKASYNTNEADLSHLINNKGQRHASGKLEEYKRLLNTCKFKLVVYFDVDKWGRQFTIAEKKENKHRRFIPSIDKVRNVINEELGLNTLIDYCLQNQNKLDASAIYLIDKLQGLEIQVFKFNAKNIASSEFVNMEFKTNEYGNTYYNRLLDTPIRTDKIRSYDKN